VRRDYVEFSKHISPTIRLHSRNLSKIVPRTRALQWCCLGKAAQKPPPNRGLLLGLSLTPALNAQVTYDSSNAETCAPRAFRAAANKRKSHQRTHSVCTHAVMRVIVTAPEQWARPLPGCGHGQQAE